MGFAVTTYTNGAKGLLESRIVSLDQTLNLPQYQTQVEVDEDRYELFRAPSETVDKALLSTFIDPINDEKTIIVNNGDKGVWDSNEALYTSESDALNALETIYGPISDSDAVISDRQAYQVLIFNHDPANTNPNPPSFSASANSTVTQSGVSGQVAFTFSSTPGSTARLFVKNATGSFNVGSANTISISGTGYTGPNSKKYLGAGSVSEDISVAHFYPNLEPPDPSTNDIFGSAVNIIVTDSNAGQGFGNTFFPNGLSTSVTNPTPSYGEYVDVNTQIPILGDVYTFNTTSGSSNKNAIDNAKDQINILRYGDPSDPNSVGVSSYNAASINLKGLKKGHAVNAWSGKRMTVVASLEKQGLQAAIDILDDPQFFS